MELQLTSKKGKIESFPLKNTAICGISGSGKTVIIRNMLANIIEQGMTEDFDFMIITPVQDEWSPIFEKHIFRVEHNQDTLDALYAYRQLLKDRNELSKPLFIFVDRIELLCDVNHLSEKFMAIRDLFEVSEKGNMYFIITSQSYANEHLRSLGIDKIENRIGTTCFERSWPGSSFVAQQSTYAKKDYEGVSKFSIYVSTVKSKSTNLDTGKTEEQRTCTRFVPYMYSTENLQHQFADWLDREIL